MRASTPEDFWRRVGPATGTGCREWTGTRDPKWGYGQSSYRGGSWRTHRLAYTLAVGPIPEGMFVLHRCDNPPCCEPTHLFVGTHADNMADMVAKGRQHFDPARGDNHGMRLHPERRARGDRHGTHTHPETVLRGDANGYARLTAEQVADARSRYAAGGIRFSDLASEYGVDPATVRLAVRGVSWSWLPGAIPR